MLQARQLFSYGQYWEARRECVQKFGEVFNLPIIADPTQEAITQYVKGSVLDIGAGKDLPLKAVFNPLLKEGKYLSCDKDQEGVFDYQDISEIKTEDYFSLVVTNQLFEHLEIEESMEMFSKVYKLLNQNGKFITTIPNVQHPTRYWGDITHKTPWSYTGLYMLFKSAGFEVNKIARYSKRHPKNFIEKFLAQKIGDIYRIDWCDSILAIGQKIK